MCKKTSRLFRQILTNRQTNYEQLTRRCIMQEEAHIHHAKGSSPISLKRKNISITREETHILYARGSIHPSCKRSTRPSCRRSTQPSCKRSTQPSCKRSTQPSCKRKHIYIMQEEAPTHHARGSTHHEGFSNP